MSIRHFEVTISPNQMKAICIQPTPAERAFLHRVLRANLITDAFYQAKRLAHPFLQSDHDTYILIEFWKPDGADEYVSFLNSDDPHVLLSKQMAHSLVSGDGVD